MGTIEALSIESAMCATLENSIMDEPSFYHTKFEQIADSLSQMNIQMAKLIAKLEAQEKRGDDTVTKQRDHEERLRLLEKFRWQQTGIMSAVTFAIGVIVTVLVKYFLG